MLTAQGELVIEGVRAIGVTEATYYRWRAEYGGLKLEQNPIIPTYILPR